MAIPTLSVIASVLGIPYPIVLVLGAIPLGYVPGVPDVELDPELVLVIFLPPLLYVAAFFADLRALRADARAVAHVDRARAGHHLRGRRRRPRAHRPAVGGRLRARQSSRPPTRWLRRDRARARRPCRLVTLIEGESLVNDSSALIAYRVAVAAAIGGSFSLFDATVDFVVAVLGGIAVGLLVGAVIAEIGGGSTTFRRDHDFDLQRLLRRTFRPRSSAFPASSRRSRRASTSAGSPQISTAQMRIQGFAV